jgi:hypothetical protein
VPLPPAALALTNSSPSRAAKLEVVSVGAFAASYVPALTDFDRSDARFRIDAEFWRKLPGCDRMSFAVFKLMAGKQHVHPMCFTFPRAGTSRLSFPTLRIHDGQVHERESFDHEPYAQGNGEQTPDVLNWEESRGGRPVHEDGTHRRHPAKRRTRLPPPASGRTAQSGFLRRTGLTAAALGQ